MLRTTVSHFYEFIRRIKTEAYISAWWVLTGLLILLILSGVYFLAVEPAVGSVTVTNLDPDPYLRERAACRFRS